MSADLIEMLINWFPFLLLIGVWVFFVWLTGKAGKTNQRVLEINQEIIELNREMAESLRSIEAHLKDRKP